MGADSAPSPSTPSEVPDVLAPGLAVVFCGINPGRVSAAAGAHFANPRNDFWRLLHDAGFTPRLFEPHEQFEAARARDRRDERGVPDDKGSGDLRRGDFAGSAERLERIARELRPRALAFVGKEAFRGVFGERPELGPQDATLRDVGLFVLPSTSPANAAVPYAERLRWFTALRGWLEPVDRAAARALVARPPDRTLLVSSATRAAGAGGRRRVAARTRRERRGDDPPGARRGSRASSTFELGPEIWTRDHTFAWYGRIYRQRERIHLVRVDEHEPAPTIDLAAEHVHDIRWWTLARARVDRRKSSCREASPRVSASCSNTGRRRRR